MKLKMFCVYDSKVSMFLQPFFFLAVGQALRAWEQAVNDSGTNFCRFPSDFTLFEIGVFDESTGVVEMHESKINLGTALEFKSKVHAEPVLPMDVSAAAIRGVS